MIQITIASDKANITVMCERPQDLLGSASAAVASFQDLTQGRPQ